MLPTLEKTVAFIQEAHSGQTRRNGVPYFTHPIEVMNNLYRAFDDVTDEEKHAALLHDVVEDTTYTINDLYDMGYSKEVLDIVHLVSCDVPEMKHMPYADRVQKIIDSGNVSAMKVKYADNMHNISDTPTPKQLDKYGKTMKMLEDALRFKTIIRPMKGAKAA